MIDWLIKVLAGIQIWKIEFSDLPKFCANNKKVIVSKGRGSKNIRKNFIFDMNFNSVWHLYIREFKDPNFKIIFAYVGIWEIPKQWLSQSLEVDFRPVLVAQKLPIFYIFKSKLYRRRFFSLLVETLKLAGRSFFRPSGGE